MSDPRAQATLRNNLRAIAQVNPELARRVGLSSVDDHISTGSEGQTIYHYGRVPRVLDLQPEDLVFSQHFSPPEAELVIAGIGLGEVVNTAIDSAHSKIRAWERDPTLLRLALSRNDWSQAILDSRLVLYLGIDCIEIPQVATQGLWCHPVLEGVYAIDMPLLRQGVRSRRALICAGELFVKDIAEALEEQGFSVYTWDIQRLDDAELERTVKLFQPRIAFAINFTDGLSEACASFGLPLAIWEIDPNTGYVQSSTSPQNNTHVFTYRHRRVELFKEAGFPNTSMLPLAANTDRRKPQTLPYGQENPYAASISFVGASMVETALRFQDRFRKQVQQCYPSATPDDAHALQEEVLALQRADFQNWKIPELLEERAPGFQKACKDRGLENPNILLGEMSASEKRLTCIAQLGCHKIQVWGDSGWKHILNHGIVHRGYAGHFKELNHIYCDSQINIDVGRLYQSDIVPMRIFDILACGGFVLAEYNEAIEELFVLDEEIVCWKSFADLRHKADYFLRHPEEARSIALAGRARVCRDHRIKDRVHGMLRTVLAEQDQPHLVSLAG